MILTQNPFTYLFNVNLIIKERIDMKKQDYILAISQFQDDMANFSGDEEVLFDYMSILDPNDDSYIYDDIEVLKMIWNDLISFLKRNKKELLEGGVKFKF